MIDIFQHDSDPNHSVNALEAYLGREINHIETRAINVNALEARSQRSALECLQEVWRKNPEKK